MGINSVYLWTVMFRLLVSLNLVRKRLRIIYMNIKSLRTL